MKSEAKGCEACCLGFVFLVQRFLLFPPPNPLVLHDHLFLTTLHAGASTARLDEGMAVDPLSGGPPAGGTEDVVMEATAPERRDKPKDVVVTSTDAPGPNPAPTPAAPAAAPTATPSASATRRRRKPPADPALSPSP